MSLSGSAEKLRRVLDLLRELEVAIRELPPARDSDSQPAPPSPPSKLSTLQTAEACKEVKKVGAFIRKHWPQECEEIAEWEEVLAGDVPF